MFTQLRRSMPSTCTWAPSHKSPAVDRVSWLFTSWLPAQLLLHKYSKAGSESSTQEVIDGSCFQTLQLITV